MSCEKDFLDINDDPNNPLDVSLDLLLPSAQLDLAGALGYKWRRTLFRHGVVYASMGPTKQRRSMTMPFREVTFLSQRHGSFYIRGPLPIWKSSLTKGTTQEAFPYVGIAQIMKAYTYSLMVDVWGDVPFSEAHKADNLLPHYDKGEDIYPQLFALLDEGIANMEKESLFEVGSDDLVLWW